MHIGTHHITDSFHRKKVIPVYLWNGCVPMEGMCTYGMGVCPYGRDVYLYGRGVYLWKGCEGIPMELVYLCLITYAL